MTSLPQKWKMWESWKPERAKLLYFLSTYKSRQKKAAKGQLCYDIYQEEKHKQIIDELKAIIFSQFAIFALSVKPCLIYEIETTKLKNTKLFCCMQELFLYQIINGIQKV